jgi:hypothetical protein
MCAMPVIQQSGGRSRRILSRDQPGLHSETMSLKKKKTVENYRANCCHLLPGEGGVK